MNDAEIKKSSRFVCDTRYNRSFARGPWFETRKYGRTLQRVGRKRAQDPALFLDRPSIEELRAAVGCSISEPRDQPYRSDARALGLSAGSLVERWSILEDGQSHA